MHLEKEYLIKLLSEYTERSISEKDYEILMRYVRDAQHDAQLYEAMDGIWKFMDTGMEFSQIQKKHVFNQIITSPRFTQNKNAQKDASSYKFFFKVAAAFFCICFAGITAYYLYQQPVTDSASHLVERIVPRGQKLTIKFPDGSTVFMNSGSKLRYPERFASNSRELFLEGEAYFDVAHDPHKPFIVHSGNVITQVLGTAFNISAYHQDKISVTVTRGKVSVSTGQKNLGILLPSEKLVYNQQAKKVVRDRVDAGKVISWKEGDLILDDVTMKEAAEIISRWYDVDFSFDDPLLNDNRFTVSFLKGESITEIMKVLSYMNHISYIIDGNTIHLNTTSTK